MKEQVRNCMLPVIDCVIIQNFVIKPFILKVF